MEERLQINFCFLAIRMVHIDSYAVDIFPTNFSQLTGTSSHSVLMLQCHMKQLLSWYLRCFYLILGVFPFPHPLPKENRF